MRPVYKQVSTVRAQSLAYLSGEELTVEIIKNQILSVPVYTFISISLRLGSGMVSVQPQLSFEAGLTLVLLFLTFHMWWGLKEGCPIGLSRRVKTQIRVFILSVSTALYHSFKLVMLQG